ncbi:hypothetical protein F5B22DRAFT_607474 [Xylaria bambusicola]|uniref:uncharacterized protein n=1 Tax=Xylaria bambusicola TaxID=326684 RepID=UPI002007FB23|nr:uncharacterized protein F5B22DRAFT_607474 [Xylaria bambusicola]KAI0515484.1 hypothetical protein F5B22DRAFT_607474 [Xylaria bambusicola]
MSPNSTIDVYEVEPTTDRPNGERMCSVRIVVDGECIWQSLQIQDPFREDDKKLYDWYLETYPLPPPQPMTPDEVYSQRDEAHEFQCRADIVQTKLEQYGEQLHKSLKIEAFKFLNTQYLHINIWEAQKCSETTRSFGIHQILWENLEKPHIWRSTSIMASRLQVAVKRIVMAPPCPGLPWESRRVTRKSPLRVLLVVARNLRKTAENRYEDLKPHIAQIHLLSVQDDLVPLWFSPQVELHIARPGSYSALEEILTEEGKGYFDLVHFDLHGDTNDDPLNAYLWFASENIDETQLVKRKAEDVADLLAKTGVRCVATNACRTAVSYERREANMCQIFIDKGISHVSGMSHNICTDAVDLFYWGFYSALITKGFKFAEAASQGRKSLRLDKHRNFVASKQLVDWCVPVTYMCPDGQVCGQGYSPFWIRSTRQTFRYLTYWVRNLCYRLRRNTPAIVFPEQASTRRTRNGAIEGDMALHSGHSQWLDILYGPQDFASRVPKSTLPKLDINILDFEKHLVHHGTVYFHGPNHSQNVDTMIRLGLLWCRTNFVERVIYINARQYSEGLSLQYVIECDKKNRLRYIPSRPIDFDPFKPSSPHKKLAIVIQGIHELYPDDEDEREAQERDRIRLARQKVEEFLTMEVTSKLDEKDRYVVITGEKDAEWWESTVEVGLLWGQPFWRGDPLLEHFRDVF